jgi:hypothetical protein
MGAFRNILVVLAILMASGGPLPLVAHHLTCHHFHAAPAQDESASSDSCHRNCHCSVAKSEVSGSTAVSATEKDENCAVCFQLAQLSHSSHQASSTILQELSPEPIVHCFEISTAVLLGPQAPRGPPAA